MNQTPQNHTPRQQEHYELEKSFAVRLKGAAKSERPLIYAEFYDELFRRFPDLRAVVQKNDPAQWQKPSPQFKWLKPYLTPDTVFVDIGSGNAKLAFEVSRSVRKVYAVEVSREIAGHQSYPDNFELIISDACNISLPPDTADIIYSRHVIEHLHPDDAQEHLRNAQRLLRPSGVYICLTPNRLFGPHDASKGIDPVASGSHLKEYTISELAQALKQAGFQRVNIMWRLFGMPVHLPLWPFRLAERILYFLPHPVLIKVGNWPLVKLITNIRLIARKG